MNICNAEFKWAFWVKENFHDKWTFYPKYTYLILTFNFMNTTVSRLYNCKDEELVPISRFILFSLKRDQADFLAYSSIFNPDYVTELEAKIAAVSDLLEPQSETLAKKLTTERLYTTFNGLMDPLNRLSGYLMLAQKSLNITPTAFGITDLRKSLNGKDAEGISKNIRLVLKNIATYKAALTLQGLTQELIDGLTAAMESIIADKQQQYEITINRKGIVQNNGATLNGLYEQLTDVTTIGKILYKTTDKVKLSEYTFSDLLKKVRQVSKNETTKPVETISANN